MRYRKPSLKQVLGLTKAKKKIKKELGVYEVTKYTNASKNMKRRVKRAAGYESGFMKFFRAMARLFGK